MYWRIFSSEGHAVLYNLLRSHLICGYLPFFKICLYHQNSIVWHTQLQVKRRIVSELGNNVINFSRT